MNLLILTFLFGMFAVDGDEPQAKPAPQASPAQDPDRPAISAADLKALRETNIFAPKGIRRIAPSSSSSGRVTPPTPYRQKPPVVTAIFLDLASQTHQVIVEDRNDSSHRYFKEPKFMKIGDEWAGVRVESVTQDVAVFNKAGASLEVHIGDALPETDAKPLSSSDASDEGRDDGEAPLPAESSTSPSKSLKTTPESKTQTSEEQNRVLDEMRRKNKKKNRPGAGE